MPAAAARPGGLPPRPPRSLAPTNAPMSTLCLLVGSYTGAVSREADTVMVSVVRARASAGEGGRGKKAALRCRGEGSGQARRGTDHCSN